MGEVAPINSAVELAQRRVHRLEALNSIAKWTHLACEYGADEDDVYDIVTVQLSREQRFGRGRRRTTRRKK